MKIKKVVKMKITLSKNLDSQEALFLGLFAEDTNNYSSYNSELSKELSEAIKNKSFQNKWGETFATRITGLPYKRVIVMGLGKRKEFTLEKVRRSLAKAVSLTRNTKFSSLSTNILELSNSLKLFPEDGLGQAAAEGLLLANYAFSKYLSSEKKDANKPLQEASLYWKADQKKFGEGLKVGRIIAEATNFAKDTVNEPANMINSLHMEKLAKSVASSNKNITLQVLEKADMEKLGMGAILGVNRGSEFPPKMIFLQYKGGNSNEKYTAIIGKGITFDSGGYNLKPTGYMEDMKCDKSGAVAVLATIKAAAELGLKKNILGVMAVTDNAIGSKAQKPGDIVKAYNQKTIEINNTDAEGRLVLADALSYTEDKYKPEIMIDLATLTGACMVALGYYASGLISNDEKLSQELSKAGDESGDRLWAFPFYEDYQDWMDGDISDLKNSATRCKGREGGAITAGVFLNKFVEKTKWAHLDIAGPAFLVEEKDYNQKGATGAGVRVLLYYLMR